MVKKGQIPEGADCYEILSSSEEDKIYTKQMNDEIREIDRLKAEMTRDIQEAKFSFLAHVQGQQTQISPKERQFRVRENYIKYFQNNIGINIEKDNFKAKYQFKLKETEQKGQKEVIIDPRHIIVFGVDLMSGKRIKSKFTGLHQPTIKWINSSNVSIKFNQNQDLQTLLQMQKLHKQNKEFIQNQDSHKKPSVSQWIELKPYHFLKFQRTLEFRYASTEEQQLETQKSDDYKKFIDSLNNIQSSELFLKTDKQKNQYDAQIRNFAEQMEARYKGRRATSRSSRGISNDGSQARFRSRDQRRRRRYSQQFEGSEGTYRGGRTQRTFNRTHTHGGAKTSRMGNQTNHERRNNFDRNSQRYGNNRRQGYRGRGRGGYDNEYNAREAYHNRNFNKKEDFNPNYDNEVKQKNQGDLLNSSDISFHIEGKTDFQRFQQQNHSCSNSSLQMERNNNIKKNKANNNDISLMLNDQTLKQELNNKDNNVSVSFGDQSLPLLDLSGINGQKNNNDNISFMNENVLIDIDRNQTSAKADISFVQELAQSQLSKRNQNQNQRYNKSQRQRNQQSFGSFSRGNGDNFKKDNDKFANSNRQRQRNYYNSNNKSYNNNRNYNEGKGNYNNSSRQYNNHNEKRHNGQNGQSQQSSKPQWDKIHEKEKRPYIDSEEIDY